MNGFTFSSPTEFVFGPDVTDRVGEELKARGYGRAYIVYGKSSVVRTGTLDRVKRSLDAAGIAHDELGGVRPNPSLDSVREGIEAARAFGADVVLPVGGGSVIDCAKAVALGVPYDGDVWDFFSKKAVPTDHLPVACVLTIPAAGSEGSNSCVITHDGLGLKRGCNVEANRPVVSFLDPKLTYTLPPYQTAAGVTDMIAHVLERYFSGVGRVPLTDRIAAALVRPAMAEAPRALENPEDYEARANIMWTATLAHNDLAGLGRSKTAGGRAGDWASHGLEHELSALDPGIAHGAGLAVLMPAWMRHVWKADPSRFLQFAYDMFDIEPVDDTDEAIEDAVTAAIDELQSFFVSMGMPCTLGELGIEEKDIEKLVEKLEPNKGKSFGAFSPLGMDDARAIYRSAL